MSKNMTRKSIALASGLALASSAVVATPAKAVETLDTVLNAGIHYNTVTGYGNGVTLKTLINAAYSASDDYLKYRVVNTGLATVELLFGQGDIDENVDGTTGKLYEYTKAVALTDADGAQDGGAVQTADNDFVLAPGGGAVGLYTASNLLQVSVKDATAKDYVVTVQAWLDVNGDNEINTTEYSGPIRTLNFYDETNVTATASVVAPVVGAASVQATFTTTPSLNGNALGADFFDVAWTSQGNANAVLAKNSSSNAAASPTLGTTTYSALTDKWTSTFYLAYAKATDAFNGTDAASATTDGDLTDGEKVAFDTTTDTVSVTVLTHGLDTDESYAITSTTAYNSGSITTAASDVARPITFSSATAFSFVTEDTGLKADSSFATAEAFSAGAFSFWSVGTNATVQAAGTYSATPYIGAVKVGAIGSTSSNAETATNTKATVAASVNVSGGVSDDPTTDGETAIKVRPETTSVTASAVVYYTDVNSQPQLIGAGVPVTCSLSDTAGSGTFKVNGELTSDVVYTDAASSVSCTVTTTTAANGDSVDLEIRPQSLAADDDKTATFDFVWETADYVLYDLQADRTQPTSSTLSYRSIDASETYTFKFAYLDQWGVAAPDSTYRVQVVNADRTVTSGYHSFTNGRVDVTVADQAQGASSKITTTVNVQKLTAGVWGAVAADSWNGTNNGKVQINVVTAQTDKITLDADGAQLYEYDNSATVNADLQDAIAADDVVAQDRRFTAAVQPTYTNDIVMHGRVTNTLTGQSRGGQFVTVSGPSNVLFSSGNVDAFGSLTVVTSDEGDFTVKAFSNIAQKNTVITFTTPDGATKTTKITIDPAAATAGATLTVETPTYVEPGTTFSVVVTVKDEYGNPVNTGTNDQLQITYTGPGIVFGTIPDDTNAAGQAKFSVLLGSKDTGSVSVTAIYDTSDNGTFGTAAADLYGLTADLSATSTSTVGSAPAAAADTKVNAGSFKGYVAIYAKGYEGKRLSAKVGADWVVVPALASNFERVVEFTGAGYTIAVRIYIDRVLVDTITVVTK